MTIRLRSISCCHKLLRYDRPVYELIINQGLSISMQFKIKKLRTGSGQIQHIKVLLISVTSSAVQSYIHWLGGSSIASPPVGLTCIQATRHILGSLHETLHESQWNFTRRISCPHTHTVPVWLEFLHCAIETILMAGSNSATTKNRPFLLLKKS